MSRPSPDYPMLPTIPLSAFSDPKKNKPSHGSKVSEVEGQRCGAWAWPLAVASHRHHHMQSPALHTCCLHPEPLLLLLVASLASVARSGAWHLAAHFVPSSSSITGLMGPLSCPAVICPQLLCRASPSLVPWLFLGSRFLGTPALVASRSGGGSSAGMELTWRRLAIACVRLS